jgi:hypothetical protein
MKVKTKGGGAVTARLKRISSQEHVTLIGKAVFEGAKLHTVTAQRLITSGSVSGKGHVASRPGEPPNRDTGVLDNNIEASQVGVLKSISASNAPYAAALELGTSRIAARPYMAPATDLVRERVVRNIAAAASADIRRQ